LKGLFKGGSRTKEEANRRSARKAESHHSSESLESGIKESPGRLNAPIESDPDEIEQLLQSASAAARLPIFA
ncbi:unnamed protein product, partial [Heterosigma akashiwo]